jgi:signal recognition particle subunit SRP54
MFDNISKKIEKVFHYIKGYGKLTEENVKEAARQIRLALLEADVHYSVVKQFVDAVKNKALNTDVMSSMTPGKLFVKIVHDELIDLLASENAAPVLPPDRINRIVLFGANGSGKTTTTVKLAKLYAKYNPLVVAGDLTRPAAIDQLVQLCSANGIALFHDKSEKSLRKLVERVERAESAITEDHRLVIYDTAGRFDTDSVLMDELKSAVQAVKPHYRMMVVDAGEGQKGVELVKAMHNAVGIDHLILSKMDSDSRGGLVLSVKMMTGLPVAFMTTGEKVSDIEPFNGTTVANRIMNVFEFDIKAVQDLQTAAQEDDLTDVADPRDFNLNHFLKSLSFLEKGNVLSALLKNIPGLPKGVSADSIDRKEMLHFKAMIQSMTPAERQKPGIVDYRRRLRIAKGSGTDIKDVNILMKRFFAMQEMMRKMSKKRNFDLKDIISMQRR